MLGVENVEDKRYKDNRKEDGGDIQNETKAFPALALGIEEYLLVRRPFHLPSIFLRSELPELVPRKGTGFSPCIT
jgi:hypothetical protein